jgi:hypothetical protein
VGALSAKVSYAAKILIENTFSYRKTEMKVEQSLNEKNYLYFW